MLKRSSIRTKLVVACGFLFVVVSVLAGSCLVCMNRYADYTEAMRLWSFEFQKAHALYQTALDLKSTKDRIHRYNRGEMLTSAALTDPLIDLSDLEADSYFYLMSSFSDQLDRYTEEIDALINQRAPTVWANQQRLSLQRIREAYSNLEKTGRRIPNDIADFHTMIDRRQDSLVEATQEHLDATRDEMNTYSAEVRENCIFWFNTAILCSVSAGILGLGCVVMFFSHVVKPFQTLLIGTRLVASGQHSHHIDLGTGDELDELADVVNKMTERFLEKLQELEKLNSTLDLAVKERSREAVQNEQLASVGFLAAGVAHEINNPLAAIAWSAESLQSRAFELASNPPDKRILDGELLQNVTDNLRRIEDEAYRCKQITEKLLHFSRPGNSKRIPTNLTALTHDVIQIVSKVSEYRETVIEIESNVDAEASVNPQEVRQVVLNLLTNALESLGDGGRVLVKLDTDADEVVITVTDNGCGMSPEVKHNLFEPFYTRRRNGGGTGLGLSISRRIAMQHGGSLQAYSEGEGRGASLELRLPTCLEIDNTTRRSDQGCNDEQRKVA